MRSEELVKLSHLRHRLGLVYGAYRYQEEDPSVKTLMDLLEHAVRAGKKVVESWGGRLYFVYLPDRGRYAYPTSTMSATGARIAYHKDSRYSPD